MSSIFGQPATSKPNPFGSLSTTAASSNFFGQPASSSSSAPATQATTGGSLFDRITPAPQKPASSIFGAQTQSSSPPTINIFGAPNQQPQAPSGSNLFGGTLGGLGSTTQQQTSQPAGSIFGGSTLFGGNTNTLGGSVQQNNAGGFLGGLGQSSNQQTQQQGNSLFGGFGQNAQQQQQVAQQPVPYGTKTVMDQMEAAYLKWHPYSGTTLFQAYLYNSINPDQAPFYGPTPADDEAKWEEALRNRPNPATIPTSVRGFRELGLRAVGQRQALDVLHGRLHEIVEGLNAILRKHDLDISTRAVAARRRHIRLSNKCLTLAAKAQILKNRGYALDGAEEELRKKLLAMEKKVFDPALNGRGEEIWARMVGMRERGRQLEREFERAGRTMEQSQTKVIDESVFARCRQILEGYSSQIQHLAKEMEQISKEFAEWEKSQKV
ncbi:MAG: hypothetical protein HETSPECPRED_008699 [Heterodermia speciosa]|uniref:Nucleoporin Nup54 alpha-helical domain-containing protein n=1 Tax=Heterodermia speciosa TaxID=116794 RepID=A0A8H3IY87_9LECA|nr:MAG: hypothetical protein HETSPECPRED_008699 [Heterodermia speciosa]